MAMKGGTPPSTMPAAIKVNMKPIAPSIGCVILEFHLLERIW